MMEPLISALRGRSIFVAGLARNCETTLRREVLSILNCLPACKTLYWLIVESDSTDNTFHVLQSLESDLQNFRYISLGSLQNEMPIRTERMAHCRNVYLDELRRNPVYSEVDYVIIADFDGVNNLLTPDGVLSCFSRSGWDVCAANQRGPYYDIWALRHPLWSPNDCWKQQRFLIAHGVSEKSAIWAAVFSRMIEISETEEWLEVESAFGGLAVYRRAVLGEGNYVGIDEEGGPVCEHVSLNNHIRSKGHKIFINPKLINTAGVSHSREAAPTGSLERRVIRLLRGFKRVIGKG